MIRRSRYRTTPDLERPLLQVDVKYITMPLLRMGICVGVRGEACSENNIGDAFPDVPGLYFRFLCLLRRRNTLDYNRTQNTDKEFIMDWTEHLPLRSPCPLVSTTRSSL